MKSHDAIRQSDELVAQILDEITGQILRGESIDFAAILAHHPSLASELHELEPLVSALADWGTKVGEPSDSVPPTLGDFRIVRELGRGGMGIVYEAEQLSLDRRVALKVLPFAALLDERQLRRFQTEARAAAILQHDNIVSVYSVGCERGVHYYAMKLIDGPSLAEVIDRVHQTPTTMESDPSVGATRETSPIGSLSTQKSTDRASFYRSVARLGIQVAKALHYGHEEGVVHRDIKPANLLMNSAGRIHVADFGLARIQQSNDVTRSGDILGTLRYMSPEQIAGNCSADRRSDVYSLGTTLYEVLVGRAAFVGNNREHLIRSVLQDVPTNLRRIDSQVPTDLATIIHKAISKDTAERYQTAAAFADDLQQFVDHRAITARPISQRDRFLKFVQRNPVVTVLFAATVTLLTLLTTGSAAVAWKFARDAQTQLVENRRQTLGVYARDMRLARLALDEGDIVAAEQKLLKWVPDESRGERVQVDCRGFEWYHLWQRCHDPAIKHTISHQLPVLDVAFSPDGSKLVDGFFTNDVPVWELVEPSPILSHRLPIHSVQPCVAKTIGDYLVVGDLDGYVSIWDWATSNSIAQIDTNVDTDGNIVCAVDINVERKLLAMGVRSRDGISKALIWDIARGEVVVTTAEMPGTLSLAFDSRGHLMMCSAKSTFLRTIDPSTGLLINERNMSGELVHMAINDRGTRLALAMERDRADMVESTIVIYELIGATYEESPRFALGDVRVTCLAFSQDERELAFGDQQGNVRRIDLDDRQIDVTSLHFGKVNTIKFSPDGRRLATAGSDGQTHLLRRNDLAVPSTSITHLKKQDILPGYHVGFLDHGQTVCSGNGANQIDLWDADVGEEQRSVHLPEGPWNALRLGTDPDRKRLAIVRNNWPPYGNNDEVVIWDGRTLELGAKHYRIPDGIVATVVPFSPDGRYVGVTGPGHATLIDLARETTHKIELSGWVKSCAFSHDGKTFACAPTTGPVRFFDVETLAEVRPPIVMDAVSTACIAYSPLGNLLASTGFEGRFHLSDVTTGERVQAGELCPRYLATLSLSPDGSRIATGAMDGRVRIFSTETGDELFSIDVEEWYSYVSFSQDGEALAIVSGRDRLVVHAPNQTTVSTLSRSELGDIICRDVTYFEQPSPHETSE